MKTHLTTLFTEFLESEQASGIILILCTMTAIVMAIFFLLIGLEIERELYVGELSDLKNASLPILAAIGGMATPALLHFGLNEGTATQGGMGIPMATDIAFALGVLSL